MRYQPYLLLALLCACGGEGTGTEPEPTGPNVITPAGGVITLADGAVTITAPAGAVSRGVAVTATAVESAFPTDASIIVGAVYRLDAAPAVQPSKPLRIAVKYDPADGPAGVPESHYGVGRVEGAQWREVTGAVADTAANTVTADISAFGIVAARRSAPATACVDARHRDFDFWVGNWQVGQIQSDITSEPSGCAIFEHWKAANPGRSISVYDPRTQLWYQTYNFGSGAPLKMSGGLDGEGRMVMYVRDDANRLTGRWTWTRHADGTVTQVSEGSTDNGRTWGAGFNGTYVRR